MGSLFEKNTLLTGALALYCLFSVFFPLIQLFFWAYLGFKKEWSEEYSSILLQTFGLCLVVAFLINAFSLLLTFFSRMVFSKRENHLSLLSRLGYAIPGSVVGVSLVFLFSLFNVHYFGLFALAALFLGYFIRFFPVAFEMQQKFYTQISQKLDWTSHSLGHSPLSTFFKFTGLYSLRLLFILLL